MTNDSSWLPRLSEALGLNADFDQDWGICNADASRVVEFIAFFESHVVVHPWEPEALAELIFESCNDLLLSDAPQPEIESNLRDFVSSSRQKFPMTMEYWSELEAEGFPVSRLVREAS